MIIEFLLVTKSSFLALAVQPRGASWCWSCWGGRYQISSIFYPRGLGRADEVNILQARLHTVWSSLGQASPAPRQLCLLVTCGAPSIGVRPLEDMGDQKAEREQFLCSYCLDKISAACAPGCSEQTFDRGVISALSALSVACEL